LKSTRAGDSLEAENETVLKSTKAGDSLEAENETVLKSTTAGDNLETENETVLKLTRAGDSLEAENETVGVSLMFNNTRILRLHSSSEEGDGIITYWFYGGVLTKNNSVFAKGY
jgi:hypothetical protein